MKNWIIWVVIGILILFIGYKMMQANKAASISKAASSSVQSAVTKPTGAFTTQAVTLSKDQCKATCTGLCGGPKPLINLSKDQKIRTACHEKCASETCNR